MHFLKLDCIFAGGRFVGAGEMLYLMIHVDDLIEGILFGATADSAVVNVHTVTGRKPTCYRRRTDLFRGSSEVPNAVRERRFDAKVDLPKGIGRTATWYREDGYRA